MATTSSLIQTSGFVDAHSHLRSVSLDAQGIGGTCLERALLQMSGMTSFDLAEDVFVASCQLISSGVTAVQVVFHTFDSAEIYLEKLDSLIRGSERSGIRILVILALTDQDEFLPKGSLRPDWLPEFTQPIRGISPSEFPDVVHEARSRYPNISFGVGPVAPQWASDDLLRILGGLIQEGLRFHTHLLEGPRQRQWGHPDPVHRLAEFGLLQENSSFAHGVWCQLEDLKQIRDSGAQMVTCPQSNMLLTNTKASVDDWLDQGIPIAVGLDSATTPPSPWANARQVLDHSEALLALTVGGKVATGLNCDQDDVTWSDFESGIVHNVNINGLPVLEYGKLLKDLEYQSSIERIVEHFISDTPHRLKRLHALESVFPQYIDLLDANIHES